MNSFHSGMVKEWLPDNFCLKFSFLGKHWEWCYVWYRLVFWGVPRKFPRHQLVLRVLSVAPESHALFLCWISMHFRVESHKLIGSQIWTSELSSQIDKCSLVCISPTFVFSFSSFKRFNLNKFSTHCQRNASWTIELIIQNWAQKSRKINFDFSPHNVKFLRYIFWYFCIKINSGNEISTPNCQSTKIHRGSKNLDCCLKEDSIQTFFKRLGRVINESSLLRPAKSPVGYFVKTK